MATRVLVLPGEIRSQKLSISHAITSMWPQVGILAECKINTPILRLEDHKGEVLTCDFHPSGKLFLSSGSDRRIHVGDVYGDCRNFMVMSGHTGAVNEAHFSRNGFDVYTCSNDRTLGIWDTFTGIRTGRLDGHVGGVNSVQSTKTGLNILCSGSNDSTARIWDARDNSSALILPYGSRVTATCFSATGEYVIAGGHNNDLKIWDLRTNKVISTLSGHNAVVTGISLSPCGSYLLSHSKDNSLRIWQISPSMLEDKCVGYFQSNQQIGDKYLLRCAWSPDGTKISAGSSNNNVYVWDAMSGQMLCELQGHESNINDVAFHPDESVMLSASQDKYLLFHELY